MSDLETQLRDQLAFLSEDPPEQDAILRSVRSGYRRRLNRRRWVAVGSAAAIVLLVASAATLFAGGKGFTSHPLPAVGTTTGVSVGTRATAAENGLSAEFAPHSVPGGEGTVTGLGPVGVDIVRRGRPRRH